MECKYVWINGEKCNKTITNWRWKAKETIKVTQQWIKKAIKRINVSQQIDRLIKKPKKSIKVTQRIDRLIKSLLIIFHIMEEYGKIQESKKRAKRL